MRAAVLPAVLMLAASCAPPAVRSDGRADALGRELDSRTAGAHSPPVARPAPVEIPPPPPARREERAFDEVGVGQALSHETRDAAKARAREDALAKAMLGSAHVFYGFADYTGAVGEKRSEAVAKFLFTSDQGVVTDLSTSDPDCSEKAGVTTCQLRVRGRITYRGGPDPAFLITDAAGGDLMGTQRRHYYPGEPVHINAASTRDAYLYIFSWDMDDRLYPVFPNRWRKDNRVRAGQVLRLPEDSPGMSYIAALPPGKTTSSERLLLVASLRELAVPELSGGAASCAMADLTRRLALLERREWTLLALPYEVTARGVSAP